MENSPVYIQAPQGLLDKLDAQHFFAAGDCPTRRCATTSHDRVGPIASIEAVQLVGRPATLHGI